MPRYVILLHQMPPDGPRATHWDLMLQWGAVLRTWALDQPPNPALAVTARGLADHRIAYLDYEGPVGADRGSVIRWDAGTFELRHERQREICVALCGRRLSGILTLQRSGDDENCWSCTLAAA